MRVALHCLCRRDPARQTPIPRRYPDVGSVREGDMVLTQGGFSEESGSLSCQS